MEEDRGGHRLNQPKLATLGAVCGQIDAADLTGARPGEELELTELMKSQLAVLHGVLSPREFRDVWRQLQEQGPGFTKGTAQMRRHLRARKTSLVTDLPPNAMRLLPKIAVEMAMNRSVAA